MGEFFKEDTGATAVEFALVAPIFFLIVIGTIACGIALWSKNALDTVATEAARCIAIRNDACAATLSGCASAAQVCFVINLARERGLSNLAADNVAIENSANIGAASFTRVTITYPFDLAGYEIPLSASQSFPNN